MVREKEEEMPLTLGWHAIAFRLALSIVAGAVVGIDRGEHGRPVGLRTHMLVCLAASVAMIQVNLLLATAGRSSDSFVMLDLMRLPLGILTGMGFIGGGAILRRNGLVEGVTTAATLWFVTVMGLCFGGGQIGLGIASFALGMLVLSGLRWFESRMRQERNATLILTTELDNPSPQELKNWIRNAGYAISMCSALYTRSTKQRRLEFRVQWHGQSSSDEIPPVLDQLSAHPQVLAVDWRMQ